MIEVTALDHEYDGRRVLSEIAFSVAPGEIVAVMGSSGGGKTTLLKCISGLITPTKGSVKVDGVDVEKDGEQARQRMGMVFQSAALFDFLTVADNILFGPRRLKRRSSTEEQSLLNDTLKAVELDPSISKQMPSELSGGMRKRVGLARAIASQPKVLLYDEPTTGLDPITTYAIDVLIRKMKTETGVTSLLVSHDVNSVLRTSDRVAFLDAGKMVFLGPPADFLKADHPNIQELVRKSQAQSLK